MTALSMAVVMVLAGAVQEPSGGPPATPGPTPRPTARAQPANSRPSLKLGAFADPFGRPPAGIAATTPWLRFEDYVEVTAHAPVPLNVKAAEWWAHWNLTRQPGPPIGVPTHADILQKLSGTPTQAAVPLSGLALLAARQVSKGFKKFIAPERMLPADPTPTPTPEPTPQAGASPAPEAPPADTTGTIAAPPPPDPSPAH